MDTIQLFLHLGLVVAVRTMIQGFPKSLDAEVAVIQTLDKFILMDSKAGKIRAEWEAKTNQEILNLINHFSSEISIKDKNAAVTVIHRSIHEVFQYLYKNRDSLDEKTVLNEFVTMLKKYIS